jgi:hypothetical protein
MRIYIGLRINTIPAAYRLFQLNHIREGRLNIIREVFLLSPITLPSSLPTHTLSLSKRTVYPLFRYASCLQLFSQNSFIRSHASIISSFGTVNTMRKKPGKLKHGSPENVATLCSLINCCVHSKHVLNLGNFSSSIFVIKYMLPFGSIGIKPCASFNMLNADTA